MATFVLERWLRSRRKQGEPAAQPAAQSAPGVPHDNLDAAIQAMIATAQAGNPHSGRGLARRYAVPEVASTCVGKCSRA